MKKLFVHLLDFAPLGRKILSCTVLVWASFLLSYFCLLRTYRALDHLDLRLSLCVRQYPLLILMSLSLGIVGAILIDLYDKTNPDGL